MADSFMNFHSAAPKIPPRIVCIGMPVRDLTFRIQELPAHGFKVHATHFDEICGGNGLNAAIGIVRLGGRASICGPIGDSRETSNKYIFEKLRHEGIESRHLVHMPGLVTPISNIMIDPSGERTIVTFRDPELWKVRLPAPDTLLEDCAAVLTENRCAEFCTEICVEAVRRGIPVIVDADRAMSLREGLLTASTHLVFSSDPLQETADIADPDEKEKKVAEIRAEVERFRDIVLKAEETVEPPADVRTVDDLIGWLARRGESYAYAFETPRVIRAAIDHAHVKPDTVIAGAREIAFFPPMTGG